MQTLWSIFNEIYIDFSNKIITQVKEAYFKKLIVFSKPEVRGLLLQYL